MFFNKLKKFEVYAPVCGTYVELDKVNDDTFSSGIMGPGFGVLPSDCNVYSPVDGEVTMLFPTKHAIGIKTKKGLEILIHIGIETVNLNGEGFVSYVVPGQRVKKGDKLIDFDISFIRQNNLDPTIIIVLTNGKEFSLYHKCDKLNVTNKDVIFSVES